MECVFSRNEHQSFTDKSRNESDPRDVVPRCWSCRQKGYAENASVEKYIRFGVLEIGRKRIYIDINYTCRIYIYVYLYMYDARIYVLPREFRGLERGNGSPTRVCRD